jgi:hypothetical protein
MNSFNCKYCQFETSLENPIHMCLPDESRNKGVRIIYLMNSSHGKSNDVVYRKRFGSRAKKG